jgi:hypothetical protein
MQAARANRNKYEEGALGIRLSQHFINCHMFPLAVKLLEESLLALRSIDQATFSFVRTMVMIVIEMMAYICYNRCCCCFIMKQP